MWMEAPIDAMADRLLEKKAKTLLETLGDVKAIKLLYTLVDTVGKTEAKKLQHTLANTRLKYLATQCVMSTLTPSTRWLTPYNQRRPRQTLTHYVM